MGPSLFPPPTAMTRLFLSLLLAFVLCSALCFADEVATQDASNQRARAPDGGDILLASPDADTTYLFSDVDEEEGFQPGAISHIVLGFKNNGQRPFAFAAIGGSLYYNQDATYVLENYTAIRYDTTVQPGEEYSFTYPFRLHPKLSEGEYGLRFTALYRDESNTYATPFFNATVTVNELHRELQVQDILQVALIIVVVVGGIYGVIRLVTVDDDWLVGTEVAKHQKSKKNN